MTPPQIDIWEGDALDYLKALPDNLVHCVVTSPPYWGLRDYKLEPVVWGGEEGCEHEWGEMGRSSQHQRSGAKGGLHEGRVTNKLAANITLNPNTGTFCKRCGAWRGSLGLEPTPKLYIEHLVEIFREVRRVLRKGGVCWLNLGDSYASQGGHTSQGGSSQRKGRSNVVEQNRGSYSTVVSGLKPKDLCGLPWRVALALQQPWLHCKCGAESHASQWACFPNGRWICPACEKSRGHEVSEPGWWLRSDIIWAKPNPMPESVRDRPTRAHEYVFLLTKSARYYWDQEAVREPSVTSDPRKPYGSDGAWELDGRNKWKEGAGKPQARDASKRNIRSVWTIPTRPFPEAHFATFPPKLVEPMVRAGTSEKGCCPKCGAPWVRMVERGSRNLSDAAIAHERYPKPAGWSNEPGSHDGVPEGRYGSGVTGKGHPTNQVREGHDVRDGPTPTPITNTLGWRPSCSCSAPPGVKPTDLEVIESPLSRSQENEADPSLEVGRADYSRPRHPGEGTYIINRYEQRHYARQLQESPYREQMKEEAGKAFAHYIRTDSIGARVIPGDLFLLWLDRGWLQEVHTPKWNPLDPIPCTVLDPFAGSCTVGLVCQAEGRSAILIEANPNYVEMGERRLEKARPRQCNMSSVGGRSD